MNILNLECNHVDNRAAFLNGELDEDVYLEPPKRSNIAKQQVHRLNKCLYHPKQGSRCFHKGIDLWLRKQHFQSTLSCIHVRSTDHTSISMYVDDELIA